MIARPLAALLLAALMLGPPGPARADALPDVLERARAQLDAGDAAQAAAALRAALDAAPEGPDRALAQHLLGRALLDAGDAQGAVAALEGALADGRTAVPDFVRYALARAHGALGAHADAAAAYRLVALDRHSPLRIAAAFEHARALEAAGDADAARAAYGRFVDDYPDAPEARDARLQLAALEVDRGRATEAAPILRRVLVEAPRSRAGLAARAMAERLRTLGHAALVALTPERELERLEWLVSERRFEEAEADLAALRALAAERKERDLEVRATELLARVYRETRQEPRALELYEWLATRGVSTPSFAHVAEMQALGGDFETAERTLLAGYGRRRTNAYWEALGDLRFEFGRYEDALAAYKRSSRARRAVKGVPAELSLAWKVGWCHILTGQVEAAAPMFAPRRSWRRRDAQWPRYWKARSLAIAGRRDEALALYDALAEEGPLDYYGVLAASRAAELRGEVPAPAQAPGPPSGDVVTVSAEDGESGPARRPTVAWSDEALEGAFERAPGPAERAERQAALERLAARWGDVAPEARRAAELHRLGLVDEAMAELRVIDMDLRTLRGRGSAAFARRARADLLDNRREARARGGADIVDRKRKSRQQVRDFIKGASDLQRDLREAQVAFGDPYALRRAHVYGLGEAPTPETLDAWRLAHPVAFPELVQRFSALHVIPPYFLYAIMTVESTFHPHAVSVSNAYGLLQVIPKTGRRVAQALGYAEFSPELLLRPEVSIYFGSYYLGSLLDKFHGQELLAAAAYNAGPHRVEKWLRMSPNRPMDVFVEEIPFREARNYAKSVLENVARFRRAWHDEVHPYVSNHLEPRALPEPNY